MSYLVSKRVVVARNFVNADLYKGVGVESDIYSVARSSGDFPDFLRKISPDIENSYQETRPDVQNFTHTSRNKCESLLIVDESNVYL